MAEQPTSKPCILLVSTATRWLGTARMPRVLSHAGFEVAVLMPQNSLAEASAYVSKVGILALDTTPLEWVLSLSEMVDRVAPCLLVPCDEMALRLLFTLVFDPPRTLLPAQRERLTRLIVASVGDPAHYAVSIDKTLLPAAAAEMGVRMPPCALASNPAEAVVHAERLGCPVVLKRRFGFAGEGVAFADSIAEVSEAAVRMLRPDPLDLGEPLRSQLLVQKFVSGAHHSQALVALEGRTLGGFAWDRFVSTHPRKGQTSVLRFVESPETRAFAERVAARLRISGFFNVQFIIDDATGEASMLEINRRLVTHLHVGERVGCDLGRALFAALAGHGDSDADGDGAAPLVPRIDEADDTLVVFPREWLRDPSSPHLERYPADIPWDEPRLIAAMLAMRHED